MGSLWGICVLAECWGVEPDGMLQRNKLISPDDVQRLAEWIKIISWTVMLLLDGAGDEAAFEMYKRYCMNHRQEN